MSHRQIDRDREIADIKSSVTNGTIDMIQSATDESIKRQLINHYCGRVSTWETSWLSVMKDVQIIFGAHEVHGHWFSLAPFPDENPDNTPDISGEATDGNRRSVTAINKVLREYNLVRLPRKRLLH